MDTDQSRNESDSPVDRLDATAGLAILPLTIGIVITLGLTIYPLAVANAEGKADHLAATLALWAMSAGFVRGVGFVPRNHGLRLVFSTSACVLALALSIAAVARHWIVQ